MSIIRWDPLTSMRWPMSLFDEDSSLLSTSTTNDLDVFETAQNVVVKANMPGVPVESIEVTFDKGILWVRGEAKEEEKEGRKYYKRAVRSFSYKVAIPGNIDLKAEPTADMQHGVVTITFNKTEEAKPRKIEVKKK